VVDWVLLELERPSLVGAPAYGSGMSVEHKSSNSLTEIIVFGSKGSNKCAKQFLFLKKYM
jgi:hypothetical protein